MLGLNAATVLILGTAGTLAGLAELDAQTHNRLVLQGRPQVPLYRALLKDAQKQADLASSQP
jgi:hypothetical protein